MLGAFVVVELVLLGLGLLVTRVLAHSALHRDEIGFEHDVVVHRTPWWNHVTSFGTLLGGTETVIALTAVGCVVLAFRGHGPRLPAFLAVAVAGETTLFVLASIVIHRLRPPIPHLDGAPPTSSFPSGHTAATVALWCGLALGLARTHPGHRLRAAQLGTGGGAPGLRPLQPALPRHALADRRRRIRRLHPALAAPAPGGAAAARPARSAAGAAQAVTSTSTLPTAPSCTARCASAVRASGNTCSGRPASRPTRTAPSWTAAFTSSTASTLARAGSV